jgi:hypothetical protein
MNTSVTVLTGMASGFIDEFWEAEDLLATEQGSLTAFSCSA